MSAAPAAAVSNPTSPFSSDERDRLLLHNRFLVNVADPAIAAKAARYGYDAAEHALGWRYQQKASGASRPFTHYLSRGEQVAAAAGDEARAELRALDEFENSWFPLVPYAIKRFVVKEKRELVETAFFANLKQQPEGPAVVGSVALFLTRLGELEKSGVQGAKEAHASLVKKGLSKALVKQTQDAIARARTLDVVAASITVSEADQQEAAAVQREGFEEAEAWYADWAQTLRGKLGYHHEVRLGIRQNRGGNRKEVVEPEPAAPTGTDNG